MDCHLIIPGFPLTILDYPWNIQGLFLDHPWIIPRLSLVYLLTFQIYNKMLQFRATFRP